MKIQMLGIAVFVTSLFVHSVASAQTKPGDVLVNVPFSFTAGNHQMPAGRYVVSPVANGTLSMVGVRGTKGSMFLGVHYVESRQRQEPKLVFHRYGDSYFLAQVWAGGGNIGKELATSKAEKEIASGKLNRTRSGNEIAVVRPER